MSTRNTYLNSWRNKKNIYFLVETKHHLMQRSYFYRRKYNSLYDSKYRIYPICSKIWTSTIHYPMLCLKNAGWVANSVDPDETPRSAVSHLGLYCLLRPVCPNIYGKYGMERSRKRSISWGYSLDFSQWGNLNRVHTLTRYVLLQKNYFCRTAFNWISGWKLDVNNIF